MNEVVKKWESTGLLNDFPRKKELAQFLENNAKGMFEEVRVTPPFMPELNFEGEVLFPLTRLFLNKVEKDYEVPEFPTFLVDEELNLCDDPNKNTTHSVVTHKLLDNIKKEMFFDILSSSKEEEIKLQLLHDFCKARSEEMVENFNELMKDYKKVFIYQLKFNSSSLFLRMVGVN